MAGPTISNLTPATCLSPGALVTITGTSFTGATSPSTALVTPTINPAGTQITATAPPHAAGPVDVVVTTAYGSATRSLTYVAGPTISNLTPANLPLSGGLITITGTGFTGASLTIDGDSVTPTINPAGTQITATAPPHAAGPVDVVVTTTYGSATRSLTYVAGPTISNLTPANLPLSGGLIIIAGTGFTGASLTIDGDSVTPTINPAGTQITATAPPHAAGPVDVVVTTAYGSAHPGSLHLRGRPHHHQPHPGHLPLTGGTRHHHRHQLHRGHRGHLRRRLGHPHHQPAATQITATAPPHAAGAVDVVVTTAYGSATRSLTYVAGPTISSLTPANRPLTGGTRHHHRHQLHRGHASPSTATRSPPPPTRPHPDHRHRPASCRRRRGRGGDHRLRECHPRAYTYVAGPTISSLTPATCPSPGALVTITGTNFTGASLTIDGDSVTPTINPAGTQITATAPPHAAGAVDVVVTTTYGERHPPPTPTWPAPPSATSPRPPAPSAAATRSSSPAPISPGPPGSPSAALNAPITANTATTVTVTAPPHGAGAVDVVVTTAYGSDRPGAYTYGAVPTITSLSPPHRPLTGGNSSPSPAPTSPGPPR